MKSKKAPFFIVIAILCGSDASAMMTVAQKTLALARVAGTASHIPSASIVQRATVVNSLYESQRAFGIFVPCF